MSFNEGQNTAIASSEGIILIDAGAGTGKTTTIVERYNVILKKLQEKHSLGDALSRIFLATFTRVAAQQMKSKVIERYFSDASESGKFEDVDELFEASICTFDSFCGGLVRRWGLDSPSILQISIPLIPQFEYFDEWNEASFFRDFYFSLVRRQGMERMKNLFLLSGQAPSELLSLICRLCSEGIFPDGKSLMTSNRARGNFDAYWQKLRRISEQEIIKSLDDANSDDKLFTPDFREALSQISGMQIKAKLLESRDFEPDEESLLDSYRDLFMAVFHEDREILIEFVEWVYREYLIHCLEHSRLNYSFVMMFAYLLLLHDDKVREAAKFEYVMIDEFRIPMNFR